jgi:hypothetical protein
VNTDEEAYPTASPDGGLFGFSWDRPDEHDWQCQAKTRARGARCRNQTTNRFTPVCKAHLSPAVEAMAKLLETAYDVGVAYGSERTRSVVSLQQRWQQEWDAVAAGEDVEDVPQPAPFF